MSDRKLSVHTEHEFLQKLEDAELGPAEAQAVIESKGNQLARKIVAYIQKGGYESSISQKEARLIMGDNFLGVEEAAQYFGIRFSEKELLLLKEIPYTEATLQECKNTHILVAGYPLSIIDIRNKASNLFCSQDWYDDEKFARKEKVGIRWYLIRKEIIPGSINKTYQEQTSLISDKEEIPKACEIVYLITLCYLARNVRLFRNLYGRCQDVSSDGSRVSIGLFDSDGLHVRSLWGDDCGDGLGLSSLRKVQS